jgi:hypothetical protein
MKTVLRIGLLLFAALLLAVCLLIFFGIGDEQEVQLGWSLSHADILRAKKILHEGSKTRPDEIGTIELTEEDLNLAANYLLNRYSPSATKIELKNYKVRFHVTMTLPENPIGRYLNISFRLGNENTGELPEIKKFKAGKLLLPANVAAFVIDTIIQHSSLNEYFILATRPIKAVDIGEKLLRITYTSSTETLIQARNLLTHEGNTPGLAIYQQKLADVLARHDPEWRLSLADLLQPLFALAYQRSSIESAIEENRNVIFTVNDYVNKRETKRFLSSPTLNSSSGPYYPAFLYKRIDLAQHFIGSAAITASVNGQVAKVVGEEKELSDAQGGSGFSFIDLAADKAGTKFGEMATSSPENARKIQKAMATISHYSEFMPDPLDLPEHMDENEFKSRYQSVTSPAFQELSKSIDSRIEAMKIYNTTK